MAEHHRALWRVSLSLDKIHALHITFTDIQTTLSIRCVLKILEEWPHMTSGNHSLTPSLVPHPQFYKAQGLAVWILLCSTQNLFLLVSGKGVFIQQRVSAKLIKKDIDVEDYIWHYPSSVNLAVHLDQCSVSRAYSQLLPGCWCLSDLPASH